MKFLDIDIDYSKYHLIDNQKVYNLNSETNVNFITKNFTLIERKSVKNKLKSKFYV